MSLRHPVAFRPVGLMVGVCLLASLLGGCSTGSSPQRCEAQAYRALAQASIPKKEVRSLRVSVTRVPRKGPRHDRLEAWAKIQSCSGSVVVVMTSACYVRQVYPTGNCRASGNRSAGR